MVNVEDVVKLPIIIKKKDALLADFLLRKWGDMMDGLKRWELEEGKELEEWVIWRIFQEEPKMDLDLEPHQNQLQERQSDKIF